MKLNRSAGVTPLPRGASVYTYLPATVNVRDEPSNVPSRCGENVSVYSIWPAFCSVPPIFPPLSTSMLPIASVSHK